MTSRLEGDLTFKIDIPFTPNTGDRCVPACTEMILNTLMPNHGLSTSEIEVISGFEVGLGSWAVHHLLALDRLGIKVGWIQEADINTFIEDGQTSIDTQTRKAAINMKEYLERGLVFEQRRATKEDIISKLLRGAMVMLEVQVGSLAGENDDTDHSVLVSGFGDEIVRLENPDGRYGSKPKQIVSWDLLSTAWATKVMQYYSL